MPGKDARKQLIDFINKKAFNPILKADLSDYKGEEKEKLKHVQQKTKNEQHQFEHEFTSAEKVKKEFLSDVRSKAAKNLNKDLEDLHLPTLPSLKDDFSKLCEELGV